MYLSNEDFASWAKRRSPVAGEAAAEPAEEAITNRMARMGRKKRKRYMGAGPFGGWAVSEGEIPGFASPPRGGFAFVVEPPRRPFCSTPLTSAAGAGT